MLEPILPSLLTTSERPSAPLKLVLKVIILWKYLATFVIFSQSFRFIIQYYYLSHACFQIDAKDVFALLKKAGNPGHNPGPGEEPTFTWFKSGQEFDPEDRFKVLFKDEEDTLALVFQHINPEDAGLYTCVASTSTGKISCSAELSVEGGVTQLLKVTLNTQSVNI